MGEPPGTELNKELCRLSSLLTSQIEVKHELKEEENVRVKKRSKENNRKCISNLKT